MDINGSVNAGELEFTIELDTQDVWTEIEDQVEEKAYEAAETAAREAVENADFDIDYGQGATDLLDSYTPGASCSLGRAFEEAVQGAVDVGGWLKAHYETWIAETVTTAVNGTATTAVDADAVRDIVRTEIRHFLADASTSMRERQTAGLTV